MSVDNVKTSDDQPSTKKVWSKREILKGVIFRYVAVVAWLLPLIAFEILLRLIGWSPEIRIDDVYAEIAAERPLFVVNEAKTHYEIAQNRRVYFRPESFPVDKNPEEFRIFVLGGSTVQGRPYSIETSLTTWLELSLNSAGDHRRYEVVNCGGVSYATNRLLPILSEVLRYQADLIVIMTGHNEFLEDKTYERARKVAPAIRLLSQQFSRLKSFEWLQTQMHKEKFQIEDLVEKSAGEVDTLLDHEGGLEHYTRDSTWKKRIPDEFRLNLMSMAVLCAQQKVPVVLVNPSRNLKDCPPIRSQTKTVQNLEESAFLDSLMTQIRTSNVDSPQEKMDLLQKLLELDAGNPEAHYHIARLYERGSAWPEAVRHYRAACDCDVCPLRILTSMQEIIKDVAKITRSPLVDIDERFCELSPHELPGENLFVDHVHPTINGHQIIGTMLAEKLVELDFVKPITGWESRRQNAFDQHFKTLSVLYFEQGKIRLEGLQKWSQGRLEKIENPKLIP